MSIVLDHDMASIHLVLWKVYGMQVKSIPFLFYSILSNRLWRETVNILLLNAPKSVVIVSYSVNSVSSWNDK